ncbi:hypothetical protein EVAR_41244_1 [Eumeta japonica]|uniref:Uncharacterized protein n=1 Tax=Eumeta variegata TaxID=151549 RepID=A0A4C1W5X3_EUMVA|nr:hypothetical protein EVAR_41244_1 [Eumeta japonica]
MPRKRVRKTQRSQSDLSNYAAAYEDVKQGTSLHVAPERHGCKGKTMDDQIKIVTTVPSLPYPKSGRA